MTVIVKESTKQKFIGMKFNKLTIISYSHVKGNRKYFNCICECGKECIKSIDHMKIGHSKSCGCILIELGKSKKGIPWNPAHNRPRREHPRLRNIWYGMIKRCYDPVIKNYHRYGGRGISVCNEWHNWNSFMVWGLENGYSNDLTLDRIDNDGNYEPSNCRWATYKEQANNTRKNVFIEYKGEKLTVSEWSARLNANHSLVSERLKRGWSIEKAVTTPKLSMGYTLKNEVYGRPDYRRK